MGSPYVETDARLTIFARCKIMPGEELCISYKGVQEEVPLPLEKTPRRGTGGGRGRRKNMTSVTAHVSPAAAVKRTRTDPCMW